MRCYSGEGLLNSAINNLKFEAHLPGMNYCGPGTRLKERLARGDQPVNKLDGLCLKHDLFYDREKETTKRHEADRILAEGALQRFKSRDASFGERLAALGVAGAMKAKVKLGMGLKQASYKVLMKRCLKAMEKSKRSSENTLKHIQDGINILRNHNILTQSISPLSTRRKVKKPKPPKKKRREIEKKSNENLNISNNGNLENLQMNTELNRKRKIEDDDDDESLQAKKSRIFSNKQQQQLRKVRLAARRRRPQNQTTDTPLNLNTPLNLTREQFKRKLNDEESDNDSSDNEPSRKFSKTE